MGAGGRGQLVIHEGSYSGVNFSHFSANVKFSPSFLFEDENSICGLLEKKKRKKENEAC